MMRSPTRTSLIPAVLLGLLLPCLRAPAAENAPADIALELHAEEASRPEERIGPQKEMDLGQQVSLALEQLRRLEGELTVFESVPPPQPVAQAPAPAPAAPPPRAEKKVARIEDVPAKSAPGLSEEYGNSLYALGKYEKAATVYEELLSGKAVAAHRAWYRFQSANCSRKLGNYPAAIQAYEQVVTEAPDTPWVAEATWWSAQLKWWILWNGETAKQNAEPFAQTTAAPR